MKKKSIIIVSEPWDFTSSDGENRIAGRLIDVINSRCIVFESNYILNFDKKGSGRILILSPRFKDEDFDDLEKKDITVNGGLLLVEYKEGSSMEELKSKCAFVLIGSLYK